MPIINPIVEIVALATWGMTAYTNSCRQYHAAESRHWKHISLPLHLNKQQFIF